MNYTIRECRIEDAAAIQKINAEAMGYDYSLEETAEKLSMLLQSDTDKIFVAEVNGVTAGYVHANDYELIYAPSMKNIMGIAVAKQFRRMDIGKALLEKCEQWASETGAKGIRLVSGGTRKEAHDFYRSLGYGQGRTQLNFKKWL